jgi:iron complex outermembrane receptor protein
MTLRAAILASCTLALAQPALAQTAPAPADASADSEIIVTATKRAQNLQDVAAAITVVGGDAIDARGEGTVEALRELVPSLNLKASQTGLDSSIFLRGVGTINFSIAAEPSVAFVIDGVVQARAGEAFSELYDVERVEVLRGPQGTLFGKNASAGVINITTRKPRDTFNASLDLSYFDEQEYRARLAVDVPLGPNVRARLTGSYGWYDGFLKNLTTGDTVNGYERWGVRGIVQADLGERLELTLIGDYREADDDCCTEIIGNPPTGAAAGSLNGVTFRGPATREIRQNFLTSTREKSWGLSLQADLDLGGLGTLTSITAWRDWENRGTRDGDWLDQPFVGVAQLHDFGPQPSDTFTQEVRVAGGDRLQYVVGGFFYQANAERTFQRDVITCSATTLPAVPGGARPCSTAPGVSTLTFPTSVATFGSELTNWAIFGDFTFALFDKLRLIAGGRYTHDLVKAYHDRTPSPIPGPGVRTDGSGYRLRTTNDDFSLKAGAQVDLGVGDMAYFTYTQGYKGPAFNVFFNQNPQQLNVIEAETADAYEIGLKLQGLDGALILNTALFYAKYQNFQANNFDLLGGVVITRLTNAGDISTRGVEVDFLIRPDDNFTVSGGFAYTDAQIDEFRLPPGSPPTAGDRSGEQLPFAPTFKGNVGVNWTARTESLPFDIALGSSLNFTSDQVSDLQNAQPARQQLTIDGYFTIDASVALVDREGRYRLSFIGRNLTDENFATVQAPGGPGGTIRYIVGRDSERYFGVALRLNYGGR